MRTFCKIIKVIKGESGEEVSYLLKGALLVNRPVTGDKVILNDSSVLECSVVIVPEVVNSDLSLGSEYTPKKDEVIIVELTFLNSGDYKRVVQDILVRGDWEAIDRCDLSKEENLIIDVEMIKKAYAGLS